MDFATPPAPLFAMPNTLTLMGPNGPQSSSFWDASFGQSTASDYTVDKGISPTQTWTSTLPSSFAGEQPSQNQWAPMDLTDAPRSPVLATNQSQKRKSLSHRDEQPARTGPSAQASSDLSKKPDWAHQVVQELPDFYHVLSPSGFFLFASESIKDLAGYSPEELVGRSITEMLHPDDVDPFVKAFNQCIATKAPLSIYARFRKSDARHLVIEFTGHARYGDALPDSSTLSALTGISTTSPSIAKCFFAMGRLYPAKNTALLDSYLEHKIENERLKSQAKELYDELGEDVLSSSYYNQGIDAASFARTAAAADPNMDYTLYSSLNSSSRTAAGFHPSSRPSPTKLAPGDDKKKHKSRRGNGEQDFVCHECGTADSPEWRKGPNGPKTLCNACGLRFAKKTKVPKAAGKR